MCLDRLQFLMCPACGTPLEQATAARSPEIEDSDLGCASCARRWAVRDGIPDLTFPDELRGKDAGSRAFWNRIAHLYGGINIFTGLLRGVSIREERRNFIERLGLRSGAAVLELAAGTGSNLALLAEKVGERGTVFGLDLSSRMLGIAQGKLKNLSRPPKLVLGNSQHLPFVDGVFDAVMDGAGIKYYSDKGRALHEMLRVVKPGGKVLVTELGTPAESTLTLRQRLLLLWIPGFREGPPLDALPSDAREVKLNWDAQKTFFALEFRKASQPE